jgi:ribosomal protein S18 acetylase RimI-like enzyme
MSEDQLTFCLVTEPDTDAVVALMTQSRFPVGGTSSHAIYSALCGDALSDNRVYLAVARSSDAGIVAFLLAIVDWRAYWASFLLRHPVLGVRIVGGRIMRRFRRRSTEGLETMTEEQRRRIDAILSPDISGISWRDSGPDIAKAVFLHVDPGFRRRGTAVELYEYLFRVMAGNGVRRCDATVDMTNARAHPLHVRMGYHLEKLGNSLFATQDLERWKNHADPS